MEVDWRQELLKESGITNKVTKEVAHMLGGIGRSVVVVSDVESDLFEQAIFILTPKGESGYIDDSEEVVKEARKVLSAYTAKYYVAQKKRSKDKGRSKLRWVILAFAALAIASVLILKLPL